MLLAGQSCVFIREDDSIDLGNSYRFIQDAPQTIIHHSGDKYKGVGIEVIPPVVLSYNFDHRYIIVRSQEVDEMTGSRENRSIRYWIVDKQMKELKVEPMDSAGFYNALRSLNIKIRLKD